MKNEDAFNAYLSKALRALPGTHALKMSEKYHVGIADFSLWRGGRGVLFETKFVQTIRGAGKLLKHPFTGPQQTFLETAVRAGTPAFGVIGCNDIYKLWVIPFQCIPSEGNWTCNDFIKVTYSDNIYEFDIGEVDLFASHLFTYRVEDKRCLR